MAESRKAFVAGHPILHSRSPKIHGHWLKDLGLSGSYEAIDVAPGTLERLLDRVRSGEFAGGNVTVPLKEEAFAAVERLTPLAQAIGAVNTVWMKDGILWGDNTDITGFSANLDEKAPEWRNAGTALVLGAGGAARAVLLALAEAGFQRIHLLNRTVSRAADLAATFPNGLVRPGGLDEASHRLPMAALIINTTTLGMAGKDAVADAPFPFEAARRDAIVTDIVYVPLETPFLRAARARGLQIVDGLGMLLHQAVPGFERWFGVRPVVTPDLRALIEADLFGGATT
jgi:shikimate dehydrogenase